MAEAVYTHLRAMAQAKLARERPGHTLQATALVHEAYMRLGTVAAGAEPGTQFYGAAAEAMRRILIEHARARKAVKRGGNVQRVDWTRTLSCAAEIGTPLDEEEIEALDSALLRLEEMDPRAGEVVRLRYFAGLTLEEVARVLSMSLRSAKRDWEFARAWLLRDLERQTARGGPL